DGPPVGSDSLGGVISAIRRGDMDVPAVRPASTDHIRDRVAVADPHERDGARRAPGTRILPPTTPRAASHRSDASTSAEKPPLHPSRGIASVRTGHPASYRHTASAGIVFPSTSRNGARQESEDNADQAGRSQG